jgi:hypothetical protein
MPANPFSSSYQQPETLAANRASNDVDPAVFLRLNYAVNNLIFCLNIGASTVVSISPAGGLIPY